MQFQHNSDFPGVDSHSGQTFPATAKDPFSFPVVQPIPCARLTTRIYHPLKNTVTTVQNVLVRTPPPPAASNSNNNDSASWSDDDDDMSHSSISSLDVDEAEEDMQRGSRQQAALGASTAAAASISRVQVEDDGNDRAYWVQRTIREAIYGRVLFAVVLKRRRPETLSPTHMASHSPTDPSQIAFQQTQQMSQQPPLHPQHAEWEVTSQHAAVKELSWQHIRRERDRLAEDPIKEVAAMQYLKKWHSAKKRATQQQQTNNHHHPFGPVVDSVAESFCAIMETNIMMPLDLLSDDRHLYSIMPYCDGGELFERLDNKERFTEDEARYWMHQLLNGLENLQQAGVCHRDISLENLMVHESRALIIDLGMCLRVPLVDDDGQANNIDNVNSVGVQMQMMQLQQQQQQQQPHQHAMNGTMLQLPLKPCLSYFDARTRRRHLIRPQGTCGKWIYMSPEIYKNADPFDGFAVDMWAAGVILFLMLTGFPPWERACLTDERFKYMTAGYLVQMLTKWQIGITGDAMDLLQRMLFMDPKDRLSLDQVRAHPWMIRGQGAMTQPPPAARHDHAPAF